MQFPLSVKKASLHNVQLELLVHVTHVAKHLLQFYRFKS